MTDVPSLRDLHLDPDEIERRKQLTRDLWAGKPLDHVPVYMGVENPSPRYTIRDQFLDADKQWEESLVALGLTWQHVPENDLVPAVRPDVGCSTLATAFGAELYWGNDPESNLRREGAAVTQRRRGIRAGGSATGCRATRRGNTPRRSVCRSQRRTHRRVASRHGRRAERGDGPLGRPNALHLDVREPRGVGTPARQDSAVVSGDNRTANRGGRRRRPNHEHRFPRILVSRRTQGARLGRHQREHLAGQLSTIQPAIS